MGTFVSIELKFEYHISVPLDGTLTILEGFAQIIRNAIAVRMRRHE